MVQGSANVLSSVSRCAEVEAHVTYGALGSRIMSKALSEHILTISSGKMPFSQVHGMSCLRLMLCAIVWVNLAFAVRSRCIYIFVLPENLLMNSSQCSCASSEFCFICTVLYF